MFPLFKDLQNRRLHKPVFGGLEVLKYIGPGFLVTVGFIDPGNWAANLAAGSSFGYLLLWMVTLSTIMLIVLQHNVAHLGIASGLCLSEATKKYFKATWAYPILASCMVASIATSLAEIMGGAIALQMLLHIPMPMGAILIVAAVLLLLFTNTYRSLEKWIIAFVSLIGISFIYELHLVDIEWQKAMTGWFNPSIPGGSIVIVMSVLGAVVMPHNLFLHSEVIQSRQWNLQDKQVIKKQLKFEFFDTFLSMIIGWAINSAMILMAAATFNHNHIQVAELQQAKEMLVPLLGQSAAFVFAMALLFSGISSSITSGMAGASIFAGLFAEPMDLKDSHSRMGVCTSLLAALAIVFFIKDSFKALILSQMILSMQLPITIFVQVSLTSSKKVMGEYANNKWTMSVLLLIGAIVTYLNIRLLMFLI